MFFITSFISRKILSFFLLLSLMINVAFYFWWIEVEEYRDYVDWTRKTLSQIIMSEEVSAWVEMVRRELWWDLTSLHSKILESWREEAAQWLMKETWVNKTAAEKIIEEIDRNPESN